MQLYSYFRSTAAYRVRIALNLKQLAYDAKFVNLLGSEQSNKQYTDINPQGRVPILLIDGRTVLIQSSAILEYLEEVYPQGPLLPDDPVVRAKVRGIAAVIGCDIHPLNNLSALNYLRSNFKADDTAVHDWIHNWIISGFSAIEGLIANDGYSF